MPMRIGIIAGAAIIGIILLSFVMSLLGGGGNKPNLITVAQDQNEIIRVAGVANTGAASQSAQTTQNFAQSAALSLSSEQQQLLNFMAAHGDKLSPKLLAATKNVTTDTTLNNAIASSSFDSAFTNVMLTQLHGYQTALKTAYNGARSATEKQLLSDDYDSAALLLQQLHSPDQ